ncbi:glycoside hydrolase family 3 N-terminal domain-containing protein [Amnibacterium sp. CER49]|uniref:glycoside hydrolase family 3 N-terminal domain-containing protein n=1 Tax=Amnibacterium sp. CER49 TaxID=3039161 RepID=UPI00244790C1|nr:glycoside hydrolase family 3 N-terminal domain-containing protein [Amnibacterium sp. CER49]MDH2444156.1 glycoside hydrolase family 3 N-terminal domain-containing protein [Amnibacterium sp. CER49]
MNLQGVARVCASGAVGALLLGLLAASPAGAAPGASVSRAQQTAASMTDAELVGQLLMIGCSSTTSSPDCGSAISRYHVGSVILDGNSSLSISQEHGITAALQRYAPAHEKLLVATDQEGGYVRRMRGPGFTDYSTALVQGTWYTSSLQYWATTWGQQLKAAGINLNLAPVLDTVPSGAYNPPIGSYDREYGHTTSVVARQGRAVLLGLLAGGIDATIKHFPGLGRVTANTDTTSGVKDTVTTSTSSYLDPFKTAIAAHAPFVMMSTAIYTRIDSHNPAAFSHTIVASLLRGTLGFKGVVISDDLGAARQVSGYSVGDRAVRFIKAGGDLVLTVNASQAGSMTSAILSRMRWDSGFAAQVRASAARVLAAKQHLGLLN